jgi:hypothetical protein
VFLDGRRIVDMQLSEGITDEVLQFQWPDS